MRSLKDIKKLIRLARIRTKPDVNQAVLKNLLVGLAELNKEKPVAPRSALRRVMMQSPTAKLTSVAAVVAVAVLSVSLWNRLSTQAYALDQTVEAIQKVRFLHVKESDEAGRIRFERWVEIGKDGLQARYRLDWRPYTLAIEDGESAARYYPDKKVMVIYGRDQMQYRWVGLLAQFETLCQKGKILQANTTYHGRRVHRIWCPGMTKACYVAPETKLPIAIENAQYSYERPPVGTFEIVRPEGYVVISRRLPSAEAAPDWLVREEEGRHQEAKQFLDEIARAISGRDSGETAETASSDANQEPDFYATVELSQDPGLLVELANPNDVLKLYRTGLHRYAGCLDLKVKCDCEVAWRLSFAQLHDIVGSSGSRVYPYYLAPPGGVVTVGLELMQIGVRDMPRGSKIATIPLRATPRRNDPMFFLKTGFAFYDQKRYADALTAFQRIETSEEAIQDDRAVALIWQGHMLDLLGRREEAIAQYRKVADMQLESGVRHEQYGLSYEYTPYARERMNTPFARMERIDNNGIHAQ
jgi:tetratricopeptide (TPR) repeat protein